MCSALRFLLPLVLVLPLRAQEAGRLSLESLFHPQRRVAYVEPLPAVLRWRADGSLVAEQRERDAQRGLERLAAPGWEPRPLLNRAQFVAALAGAGLPEAAADEAWRAPFTWNRAGDAFLVSAAQDLYLVDLSGKGGARRITAAPALREAPVFSPDGAQVAYLRGSDLYVADLAGARETRLTTGGDRDHLNGRLDWLYREEIFPGDSPGAFWWAPDSRSIAFLSLDESQVPVTTLVDDRARVRREIRQPYPQAGEPNPVARLGVAGLDGRVAWMEDPFPDEEVLIVQAGWDPKGRLVANYQDRTQTWLACVRFEAGPRVLVREEAQGGWIDRLPLPVFLEDGFLWRSARSGNSHIYRHDGEGRMLAALTAGPWDVRAILGVDEKAGRVYFSANQRNPIGLDAYGADLDARAPNQDLLRLTDRPGTHALVPNAACSAWLDLFSDLETPPQQLILDRDGRVLRQAESRGSPACRARPRGRVSFQQVPTRDGAALETLLVLPPGFDPARRYPVFQPVYGGPGAPMVRNAFDERILWYQFLAQQGLVVWVCDNRSASGKGLAAQGVHRNLGAQELRDQLDGLAWLKAQGWADMDRIALSGFSYGGFLAGYALTHSKAWKLGILQAPVTDWRLYDSVFTERLMGLPEDNPGGYRAAALTGAAGALSGKILLIHGTLDGNVHLQHTVQFLDALQKAGLGAPLTLLPGSGHQPLAPHHVWTMYQAIWEFLQKNLPL